MNLIQRGTKIQYRHMRRHVLLHRQESRNRQAAFADWNIGNKWKALAGRNARNKKATLPAGMPGQAGGNKP